MKKADYKHLCDSYENKTDFYEAPDGMPFLTMANAQTYAKEKGLDIEQCKAIESVSDCEDFSEKKPQGGTEPVAPKTTSTGGRKKTTPATDPTEEPVSSEGQENTSGAEDQQPE